MSKGKPPARKSPQAKKAFSYARDRRNSFGENDKASRKAIPLRKAGENRKARRKTNHALAVIERVDEPLADVVESSLVHDMERVGGWRKGADIPLGEMLASRKAFAKFREGSNARLRAERERQRAAPDFDGTVMISSSIRYELDD